MSSYVVYVQTIKFPGSDVLGEIVGKQTEDRASGPWWPKAGSYNKLLLGVIILRDRSDDAGLETR